MGADKPITIQSVVEEVKAGRVAAEQTQTIVDSLNAKLELSGDTLTLSAPAHVCLALVQLGAIASVVFLAQRVTGHGLFILSASILAFAFFATKASNFKI